MHHSLKRSAFHQTTDEHKPNEKETNQRKHVVLEYTRLDLAASSRVLVAGQPYEHAPLSCTLSSCVLQDVPFSCSFCRLSWRVTCDAVEDYGLQRERRERRKGGRCGTRTALARPSEMVVGKGAHGASKENKHHRRERARPHSTIREQHRQYKIRTGHPRFCRPTTGGRQEDGYKDRHDVGAPHEVRTKHTTREQKRKQGLHSSKAYRHSGKKSTVMHSSISSGATNGSQATYGHEPFFLILPVSHYHATS